MYQFSMFSFKISQLGHLGRMGLPTSHCKLQLEGEFSPQWFSRKEGEENYTILTPKVTLQTKAKNKTLSLASSKNQMIKKLYSFYSHPTSLCGLFKKPLCLRSSSLKQRLKWGIRCSSLVKDLEGAREDGEECALR